MGATQAMAARLESSRTLPFTRVREHFAKATRTRLRVSFVTEKRSPPDTRRPRFASIIARLIVPDAAPEMRLG